MTIEIYKVVEPGRTVSAGVLTLADDGSVDWSGLDPAMEWLRTFVATTDAGKTVDARRAAEWLQALPKSLALSTSVSAVENNDARSVKGGTA